MNSVIFNNKHISEQELLVLISANCVTKLLQNQNQTNVFQATKCADPSSSTYFKWDSLLKIVSGANVPKSTAVEIIKFNLPSMKASSK